jgi:hypothetical protein
VVKRDEEIARLTSKLDGPREAMKASRDRWRHRCEQFQARAKYFEDTVQHIVDACETYAECIEAAGAALGDALPITETA